MSIVTVFAGAIAANFVTAWAVYLMWRIKKNENGWPAIARMLFICLVVGGNSIRSWLPRVGADPAPVASRASITERPRLGMIG